MYLVTNQINNKQYIGKAIHGLNCRKKAHEKAAMDGSTFYFHCALRKYGFNAFDWAILFRSDWDDELLIAEHKFICDFCTIAPSGYNMTTGGEGCSGRILSLESREKIGNANRGRKHTKEECAAMKGRVFSPEHRAKLSAAKLGKRLPQKTTDAAALVNRGKERTPETKAKISAANKGRRLSPETRAKMSVAKKGRKHSAESNAKRSIALKGRKLGTYSLERRTNISVALKRSNALKKKLFAENQL